MIRISLLTTLLLLTACGDQQPATAPSNDTAQAAPAPAAKAAVPLLAGNWRIAALTGAPVSGMTVSFSGGRASLAAGCMARAWAYTQDRNSVTFASQPGSNCGSAPSGQQDMVFSAIDDANLAIFDKDGREVTLSGTGGTVTLERR